MRKIIFITDALADPRIQKRQNEFKANGYETVLYAYLRKNGYTPSETFQPIIIGDISDLKYIQRLNMLRKGVQRVIKEHKNEDVVFYVFGLQIAMFLHLHSSCQFIYEEADLVHTYIRTNAIRGLLEWIDKRVIHHSLLSIFTSEGFLQFHYGNIKLANTYIIPNRLSRSLLNIKDKTKQRIFNERHIKFGFVGGVRYESTMRFIELIIKNFPQHEFHLFGLVIDKYEARVNALIGKPNFINHGRFKNPEDLPDIYSNIDFVVSTYDIAYENVKYAEPNKLYESIYFRIPIIVTTGTFLAEKVRNLGIGLDVNPLDDDVFESFIANLSQDLYKRLTKALESIEKEYAIDNNAELFNTLNKILK